MKAIVRWTLVAAALVVLPSRASAGEPAEKFLEKLRERELFDVAQWYLESLKTNPNVDAETKKTIPFEQARILVKMSETDRGTSERLKKLASAKALFDEFLKANPTHSFAGLAQVQLGNLMVERGRAWVSQAEREKKPDDKKKLLTDADKEFLAARKVLAAAVTAFEAKVKTFPPIAPPGPVRKAKTDARRDVIEASRYLGHCIYQHAQVFDKGNKLRAQYLTEAAATFHKLYEQFRDYGAGKNAAIWEARCFQEMDDLPRALGLYQELLAIERPSDEIRDLQHKAQRLAMECWNDKRQKRYEVSAESGDLWLRGARGDEEDKPDGMAIMFLTAQAYHLWLEEDKTTDPKQKPDPKAKTGNLTKKQREDREKRIKALLQRVIAGRSDYRKPAQELYAIYGKLDPNALPTNFVDAYDQAKGKFALWQADMEGYGDDKKPPAERDRLLAEAEAAARDAIKLFRLSLAFKETDKSIGPDDIHSIRYYLTFLYYNLGRYHEAALQGEFLARQTAPSSPNFSAGYHAGYIAMVAWRNLYNDAPAVNGQKLFETANLVRVAELLTKMAKPEDTQYADFAWLILAEIKLREQDFEAAAKYLEKIPAKSERRPDADLKHGQALWSQYMRLRDLKVRKQPGAPTDEQLKTIHDQAEKVLKQGIEAKRKATTEASAVTPALLVSELSLAQLNVNRGTAEGAKAALDILSKKDGILTLYQAGDPRTKDVAIHALKVLLRAYVATRDIEKAKATLADLDKLFVGDAAAGRPVFYRALGNDVSAQLKTAAPAEQEKLEDAFHEFTTTLTAKPEALDDNTLIWASESNLSIAESALKRGEAARPKVKEMCGGAGTLYKLLIERRTAAKKTAEADKTKAEADLKTLQAGGAAEEDIKKATAAVESSTEALKKATSDVKLLTIRLGRAQRLAQDYDASLKTLIDLLKADNNILDAQIEACDLLLDWGADNKDPKNLPKLQLARQGISAVGVKKPIVWGLASTRKMLMQFVVAPAKETEEARKQRLEFREKFFETDLKLDRSLLTHAEKVTGAQRQTYLQGGVNYIKAVVSALGKELQASKEWYDAYDALLKEFERALGEEPVGLKALLKPEVALSK